MSKRDFARSLRREMTDAERELWYHLRARRLGGFKFRRQHVIGPYIADFACLEAGLIVEIDGGQHMERAERDTERTQYLESHGYAVTRFWNHEVLAETDAVLDRILGELRMLGQSGSGHGGAAR